MDWRQLSRRARSLAGTPCFLVSERGVHTALARLRHLDSGVPLRHWLSLKTQPVGRLLQACRDWGVGVEVVSEFELAAALASDVPPKAILVNGVAKQCWLPKYAVAGLTVHFDSLAEVHALAPMAKALTWQVGLRCAVPQTADGGAPLWDQFGLAAHEVLTAAAMLDAAGVPVSGLHFFLHTRVARACEYRRALEHLRQVCERAHLEPHYVDLGGGLPIAGEQSQDGSDAAGTFDLDEFRNVLRSAPYIFPGVREIWLENGRFLTGAAGALVVTVLDKKERGGRTYLICDGGRVNHARPAATEVHDIVIEPNREGPEAETIVCGPTCAAVDQLGSWRLPASVTQGDMVIWLNAGAYHIPLETRFSFGLAPVVWFDENDEPEVVRERETAAEWWKQWVVRKGPPAPSLAESAFVTNSPAGAGELVPQGAGPAER
jgi:diaminopimelate decarboxylase